MADYYARHPEQREKQRLAMQRLRDGGTSSLPAESALERELRLSREADRR